MKLQVMCHERVARRDDAERRREAADLPAKPTVVPASSAVRVEEGRNEFSHVEDRAGELDLVVRSTGVSS
jgi:hypothetical protein